MDSIESGRLVANAQYLRSPEISKSDVEISSINSLSEKMVIDELYVNKNLSSHNALSSLTSVPEIPTLRSHEVTTSLSKMHNTDNEYLVIDDDVITDQLETLDMDAFLSDPDNTIDEQTLRVILPKEGGPAVLASFFTDLSPEEQAKYDEVILLSNGSFAAESPEIVDRAKAALAEGNFVADPSMPEEALEKFKGKLAEGGVEGMFKKFYHITPDKKEAFNLKMQEAKAKLREQLESEQKEPTIKESKSVNEKDGTDVLFDDERMISIAQGLQELPENEAELELEVQPLIIQAASLPPQAAAANKLMQQVALNSAAFMLKITLILMDQERQKIIEAKLEQREQETSERTQSEIKSDQLEYAQKQDRTNADAIQKNVKAFVFQASLTGRVYAERVGQDAHENATDQLKLHKFRHVNTPQA